MNRLFGLVCVLSLIGIGLMASCAWAQQPTTRPAEEGKPPAVEGPKQEPGMKPKIPDRVYVRMATTMGDIVVELNQEKAPITVKNFLDYADAGFYDGLLFHRVIDNFMIQGGGFDKAMKEKETRPPIKNEWQNGLKNKRGTIAMARLGGKADSATAQFFINVVDNARLDMPGDGAAYAVFGKVITGMEVVDKIKTVKTKTVGPNQGVPEEPVIINKVSQVPADQLKDAIAAARAEEAEEAKKAAEEAAKRAEEDRQRAETAKQDIEKAKGFVQKQGVDVGKGKVSPSGLWRADVAEGSGPSPAATDTVKVHYTGWLVDGTKFDSSVDRGSPATFPLNRVVRGWTEGVGAMKVGGKCYLIIPPELGYGPRGMPPKIPGNAVLVFQIELLEINPPPPPPPPPPATRPQG